jgi:hypothetical protein
MGMAGVWVRLAIIAAVPLTMSVVARALERQADSFEEHAYAFGLWLLGGLVFAFALWAAQAGSSSSRPERPGRPEALLRKRDTVATSGHDERFEASRRKGAGMKGVWLRVAIVAAVLIVVNLAARVGVRIAGADKDAEYVIALWSLGAMVVVLAVAAFYWARQYVTPRALAFLAVAIGASSLVVTIAGPYVSDSSPFADGFGTYLLQLFVCIVVLTVGAAIGLLGAVALGLDPTSRAWKSQADRIKTSPRQKQRRTAKR